MKKIGSAKKWFRRETDYRCSGEEGIGIAKRGGDIERERERERSKQGNYKENISPRLLA